MAQDQNAQQVTAGFRPHQGRLLAAGILVIAGALVSAIGSVVAGTEFAVSMRRWVKEQQQPASTLALTRLHQARAASQAATHAAMDAWHESAQAAT
jgi:hypothetical protein